MWVTMVFLSKGKAEYEGIGLIEVTWKIYAAVANCRLKRSVELHDALQGFRVGRRMGEATLE